MKKTLIVLFLYNWRKTTNTKALTDIIVVSVGYLNLCLAQTLVIFKQVSDEKNLIL